MRIRKFTNCEFNHLQNCWLIKNSCKDLDAKYGVYSRLSPSGSIFGSFYLIVPSSRTDFFVNMSGKSSSRRRQLSTKQWSGNKCSDVPTKIHLQLIDHRDWPGKQRWAELHALAWHHAFRNSQAFLKAYFIYLKKNVSFLFLNSTLIMLTKLNLGRHVVFSQNCCFVANFVDKALVDDSSITLFFFESFSSNCRDPIG